MVIAALDIIGCSTIAAVAVIVAIGAIADLVWSKASLDPDRG